MREPEQLRIEKALIKWFMKQRSVSADMIKAETTKDKFSFQSDL